MAIIIVSIIWGVILLGTVMFLLRKSKGSSVGDNDDKINALRMEWSDTLSKNTQLILNQLNNMNTSVGNQLSSTTKIFGEVKESLGSLDQKTQQIFEVGKDIAGLQEILQAPKMRGGLGEMFLGALLEQIMPHKEFYELQYCFKSGERVDAVIKIGKKLVSVDSKFPLESFKRLVESNNDDDKKRARREFVKAVKEHINSIADKYILPDEGTYDFALMYIPAENVYYESIIKDEDFSEDKSIFSQAISRKVIPVSPNSFYAYLQVIILGIKGLKIEEKTHEVIKMLAALKGSLAKFTGDFETLGTHIGNIKTNYERAEKRLAKFENKLTLIDSIEEKKEIEEKD
ncbi:MAG: DNA recombination protein RmuC [Candidatus Omnitrophica bacterium]|nr:DNA recombination protein RmuC [Candidatus Omnitrophota bacterium]MBU4149589.1 DNA recombination protein RmuC [Candidatus Omnitrophota bacterium]